MPGHFLSGRWVWTLLAILTTAGLAAVGYRAIWPPDPVDLEVAVFFPSTNVASWPDFVQAVKLAADERGLAVDWREGGHSCTVQTSPIPIRFQWYPAIGSFEMQQSVRQACQRSRPPIAIIGATNTRMTEALAQAILDSSRDDRSPLLLMTTATADELIDVLPDRAFRFGYSNRYQARAVVARLAEMVEASANPDEPAFPIRAILVQIEDNPFSLDLARDFEVELQTKLGASFVPAPQPFDPRRAARCAVHGWSLETATGTTDEPTANESQLAKAMLDAILQAPQTTPVVVLPAGADLFGRLGRALTTEIGRRSLSDDDRRTLGRLVFLSGDSLDYFDFAEAKRGQIPPRATPGPVIFFCHENPTDESLGPIADSRRPSVGLNREVARALLDVVPTLGTRATPSALAESLMEWKTDDTTVFDRRERRQGGGAVVAEPDRARDLFQFHLPKEWRK